MIFQVLQHKQKNKKSPFFSEGQIFRISLSLIPNALWLWVCLSKDTIPVPESIHGGYTPPGPSCERDQSCLSQTYTDYYRYPLFKDRFLKMYMIKIQSRNL